ncbi:hypothetical protein ABEG18_12955 [Alsobacter sp. KACC 23698]|uniref:Copper resistance protein CopC n=1 Tax=Alsobacter sp. KACC 23698 TaxID=3149229 RepID=A0AAU7JMI6_9HYPH
MLTQIDYLVRANEVWRESFAVQSGDPPEAVDLTGSAFRAQLRSSEGALLVVLDASTGNGRLQISDPPTDGMVSWNVPVSVLQNLEPGDYVYDVVWTDAGGVPDTIMAGVVTIERGITR